MYLHCIFAAQSFGSSPSSEGGELNAYPTAYSSELTLRRKVRLNLKTGLENGDLPQYTWPQKVFSKVSRTVKVCLTFVKIFLRPSPYEISSTSNPVFRFNSLFTVPILLTLLLPIATFAMDPQEAKGIIGELEQLRGNEVNQVKQ